MVTKADGTKFGKSASGGTGWIEKTSPYTFYQFWLNTADADVVNFLRLFTFLDKQAIGDLEALMEEHQSGGKPTCKLAQSHNGLHGPEALTAAERITAAMFAGDMSSLQEQDLQALYQDGLPSSVCAEGTGLLTALAEAGLTKSTGEARKLIQGNGIKLNGKPVADAKAVLTADEALFQRFT